jgi:hypothetical protein
LAAIVSESGSGFPPAFIRVNISVAVSIGASLICTTE